MVHALNYMSYFFSDRLTQIGDVQPLFLQMGDIRITTKLLKSEINEFGVLPCFGLISCHVYHWSMLYSNLL